MSGDPVLIDGPILLGRFEAPTKEEKPFAREWGWIVLLAFSVVGSLCLILAALLHGQWNGLLWIVGGLAVYLFLYGCGEIRQKTHRPDERLLAVLDWLRERTETGVLGSIPSGGNRTIWLTQDGVYGGKHLLRWNRITHVALEESAQPKDTELVHRVRLRLGWSRTESKGWVVFAVVCLLLTPLVGGAGLLVSLPRYGLRDDVLALLFAEVSFIVLPIAFLLRFRREQHGATMIVRLRRQDVSLERLRVLFEQWMPAKRSVVL